MRRGSVTPITSAGIGAIFWAVATLLPTAPEARAQSALMPHFEVGGSANPVAAEVRDMLIKRRNLDKELECLALNVYFESRGEPMAGQYAVASVTLNRVMHPTFPDSICGVVMQGAEMGRNRCQFSWVCDRYGNQPRSDAAWERAKQVAFATLFLDQPDPTGGAIYFHSTWVRPNWSRIMLKVGRIGGHLFYREPVSADNESSRSPS
jgi:spore germination cell wall hydrolase CwlJ-like protein